LSNQSNADNLRQSYK